VEKGRRKLLKRVSTRKLLASIKKDIKRTLRVSASADKPKKE